MATMDYEQITFNDKGEKIESAMFSNGIVLEPYKSWLYIRSDELWNEQISDFTKPTVGSISEGDIQVFGIDFIAKRYGHNKGRMVWVAKRVVYEKMSATNTKEAKTKEETFCGIAVYGHIDKTKYYVEKAGYKYDRSGLWNEGSYSTKKGGWKTYIEKGCGDIKIPVKKEIGSWVGITKYDMDKLYSLLKDQYDDDMIEAIKEKYPKLPEIDIVSFLNGDPSLFNMFFGEKEFPKDLEVKKYL